MRFTFDGELTPDGWRFSIRVPDGEIVHVRDVLDLVVIPTLSQLHPQRNDRVPTVSELAEARALPEGWTATADVVNTELIIGSAPTYSRSWVNGERTVVAPCDAAGNPIPETRAALLAA